MALKRGRKPKDPSEVRSVRTQVVSTKMERWRLDEGARIDNRTISDYLRHLGLLRADELKVPAEPPKPRKKKPA